MKSHQDLVRYFTENRIDVKKFWIGPEHPALENLAIKTLMCSERGRVLEVGYQSGAFSVPVIMALKQFKWFFYTGIDNLSYSNSVAGAIITNYLLINGVKNEKFSFLVGDAQDFLRNLDQKYDLILLDHVKNLYPEAMNLILKNDLLADGGEIFVHDVLEKASSSWRQCEKICKKFGYGWEIRDDIPSGLAIVSKANKTGGMLQRLFFRSGKRNGNGEKTPTAKMSPGAEE